MTAETIVSGFDGLIETLTLAEEALRRYNFRYAGCDHARKNREIGWRAHAGIVAHLARLRAQTSEPSADDFTVPLPPEAGQMIEENFAALALPPTQSKPSES